jgi:hypothetical protein
MTVFDLKGKSWRSLCYRLGDSLVMIDVIGAERCPSMLMS